MNLLKINKLFTLLFAASVVFSSCRKANDNDDVTPEPTDAAVSGIYIVNQGSFGASNSTLTFYNYENNTLTPDKFSAVNSKPLGAVGNDIVQYGSKMYIVVNVSSKIEVINPNTAASIKTIEMKNGAAARQPRYIVFHNGKGYVSSYDGTVGVLDTATLAITKYINVGRNPEQMAVANNKLYVANSGGFDFGNPDNSVSVIDLATETEKKIIVTANPVSVAADDFGDVYVVSIGNYDDISPAITVINSQTDQIKKEGEANVAYASPFVISGEKGYYVGGDGKIKVMNVKTETVENENFVTDGTAITTGYALAHDPKTGKLYVGDAKNYAVNGELFVFNDKGEKIQSFETGISPGKILLMYK